MQYEDMPVKKTSKKSVDKYNLEKVSTGTMLWHVIKRHKFGLVTAWALVITILYLFPFVPDLLFSAVKGF